MWENIKAYVVGCIIPLAAGGLSALLAGDIQGIYGALRQPIAAPPAFLFPVVWTVLYVLMGISSVWIAQSFDSRARDALRLYGVQLAVNAVWPILFFRFSLRFFAFFWLLLLLVLVGAMILRFSRILPRAAYLQLPYLAWLIFASYLNLTLYLLNR